jgi:hypothetical protein
MTFNVVSTSTGSPFNKCCFFRLEDVRQPDRTPDLRKTLDFAILDGLGTVRVQSPSVPPLLAAAGCRCNPETISKSLLKGTEFLC